MITKIGSSGDPVPPKGFSASSKVLCHATGPGGAYLDLTFVQSIDDRGYNIASERVDIRDGGSIAEQPAAGLSKSVVSHLPLARMRYEQDTVLFEDEDHYHTVAADLTVSTGWRITSTPKPVGHDLQCFYVPIGQYSGVLSLSPEAVRFSSNMEQYRSTGRTSCPSALAGLLQSGAKIEHVVIRSTDKVVTLFILSLNEAGDPQLWQVQAIAYQSGLSVQHVGYAIDETNVSRQYHILQGEDARLIKKGGEAGGRVEELHLTYAVQGRVVRFHLSVEDGSFTFRNVASTRILPDNLTSVITNDNSKIATGQYDRNYIEDESAC